MPVDNLWVTRGVSIPSTGARLCYVLRKAGLKAPKTGLHPLDRGKALLPGTRSGIAMRCYGLHPLDRGKALLQLRYEPLGDKESMPLLRAPPLNVHQRPFGTAYGRPHNPSPDAACERLRDCCTAPKRSHDGTLLQSTRPKPFIWPPASRAGLVKVPLSLFCIRRQLGRPCVTDWSPQIGGARPHHRLSLSELADHRHTSGGQETVEPSRRTPQAPCKARG